MASAHEEVSDDGHLHGGDQNLGFFGSAAAPPKVISTDYLKLRYQRVDATVEQREVLRNLFISSIWKKTEYSESQVFDSCVRTFLCLVKWTWIRGRARHYDILSPSP